MGVTYERTGQKWRVRTRRFTQYDVAVCEDMTAPGARWPQDDEREPVARRLVVADAEAWTRYKTPLRQFIDSDGADSRVVTLSGGEKGKARDAVARVLEAAQQFTLSRRDELVVVGGGVVLDIGGYAAGALRKGTPYVAIPTTLVGMIDAGLGAKRAVNFGGAKNFEGTYHPARLTLIDPHFLATLDDRQTRAGVAEMIKVAVMVEPKLFALFEQHGDALIRTRFAGHPKAGEALRRSISGILRQLAGDLWERELCRWPDFGHTISPLLEMETGGAVIHGEAVSICSAFSASLALGRGMIDRATFTRLLGVSDRLCLPVWHHLLGRAEFREAALASTVAHRAGHQHWPVPTGVGTHGFVEDATPAEMAAAADTLRRQVEGS